jgi:predicted transcriptional regulator
MKESRVTEENTDTTLLELATELTMAWLSNPNTRASSEEVPAFLQSMHGAVKNLASPGTSAEEAAPAKEHVAAVTARRSLASRDHIISLIDGKPYKTLKRHLSGHGLTPAEYRERYGLKSDYPMVAEAYAEMRRDLAKKIGLGRKAGTKVVAKSAAKPAAAKSAAKPADKDAKPAPQPKAARWVRPTVTETKAQS